jgi:mRNA interferase MazF
MVGNYVPEKGDLAWITFSNAQGHEQSGRRPALVLTPLEYNKKTGLCLVCPITSKTKGYSYEVPVSTKDMSGVILANHVRSISFVSRKIEKITRVNDMTLAEVVKKINFLIS